MLPSVVATGTSRPPSAIALNTVPIADPVDHAITACGAAALIRWIWADALTSVGLKLTSATSCMSLFSGSAKISCMCFSASWPVASVLVMAAILVRPFSRKNRICTAIVSCVA